MPKTKRRMNLQNPPLMILVPATNLAHSAGSWGVLLDYQKSGKNANIVPQR